MTLKQDTLIFFFFFLDQLLIDGEGNFYWYAWEFASVGFCSEEQINFKGIESIYINLIYAFY